MTAVINESMQMENVAGYPCLINVATFAILISVFTWNKRTHLVEKKNMLISALN